MGKYVVKQTAAGIKFDLRVRKLLALIVALLIGSSVFVSLAVQPVGASAKYDLPSKVTNYKYKKGKWVKVSCSKLKYTKSGYLKTVKHSDGSSASLKYSFYKSGKLKKITCPGGETLQFNKKGLVTKYCISNGRVIAKYKYKGSDLSGFWDRNENSWFKYAYEKYPDGTIKELKVNNPDYWDEDGCIVYFDENGLLVNDDPYTYKYTFDKKGRVKSVIRIYTDEKPQKEMKYVFSYNNAQSANKKSRYTSLINAHIGFLNYGQTVALGGGYMDAIGFVLPTW